MYSKILSLELVRNVFIFHLSSKLLFKLCINIIANDCVPKHTGSFLFIALYRTQAETFHKGK